jgi:hypothetical protein
MNLAIIKMEPRWFTLHLGRGPHLKVEGELRRRGAPLCLAA